jgi:thiol reductant ABC exporter CydC subunit
VSGELVRLLRLLRPERGRVLLAVALQTMTVAAGIGLMGVSAWLVSKAALHPSIAALQVAIVGVRTFGIGRAVLRYLERLVSHDATLRLLSRLRVAVYRSLAPLAPARLARHRSGDLLGRLVEDVGTLEGLSVRVIGPSLTAVAVAAAVALALVPVGPRLAGAAVGGFALAGLLLPWLGWRLGASAGRRLVGLRGELQARLVEGVQGVAELLALGREADHASALAALGDRARDEQGRLVRAAALGGSLAGLAADLTTAAVLALAIPGVRSGRIDGVSLAVVTLMTLASFEAVAALPAAWHGLGASREAARRLFEVIDTPPAVEEPEASARAVHASGASVPCALLDVRDLRFTYPGESRPALDRVSLRLDPGRRVAVVGPSGSGKSTLVHLLLRFWDVPPGTILLEGRDVRMIPADEVRARVTVVPQRTHLFNGTLRDNLRLASAAATEADLRGALRAARLESLVASLPEGLDAWIGEQGLRLSGGERQRLALARALLRPAPLLALDEPTAHLDPVTEGEVLGEIARAGEGRATLLATHRLVGLEAFDEVLVLDRGRVVERGTGVELAARGGLFARLRDLQRATGALADEALGGAGLGGLGSPSTPPGGTRVPFDRTGGARVGRQERA